MADYVPGLALAYRSSFSPVPPPRRCQTALPHARSHSVSAPKTSKLTPVTSETALSPRRSKSHSISNAQSSTSSHAATYTPNVSSPLARTSTLSGQEPEIELQEPMQFPKPFRSLREKSSRIFRRPIPAASPPAQGLQISAPSQVVLPERYNHLLPTNEQAHPSPPLSLAHVPQSVTTSAPDTSSARGSASTATKSVCRRAGVAAQSKRLQKKRRPGVLTGEMQVPEAVPSPSSEASSASIDDGEPGPSTKRFLRAPQLPALNFDADTPDVAPSVLEVSQEPDDQGEPTAVEYDKYRVDIHATSGIDFRATMSDCQQRVLSDSGVLMEDTTYLSGFIYQWPCHRENVLENGETTALGGHIDVLPFVAASAVPEPLRSHPYTAPKDRTSERVKAKMEKSKQKLKNLYGLEVDMGSKSLGKGEDDDDDWEDIE